MNRAIAVILALLGAVHVSVPVMGLTAPAPVVLAFTAVIVTLLYLIAGVIVRDGWRPVWQQGATA